MMVDAFPSLLTDLDQNVWEGIQALLDIYIKLTPDDDVVIAYTPDARASAAWVALACEERGYKPSMVYMAPLRDRGFFNRISAVIPPIRRIPGRCVLLTFEKHTMSHNTVLKHVFSCYDHNQYAVIRAINSGRDLFTVGLSAHPDELSALNTSLLKACRSANSLRIVAEGGTDLRAALNNNRYQYKSSRGILVPGKFTVIPAGEVATFPENISGLLVADFALNVNMYFDGDVRLENCPVKVQIENGYVVDFQCSNSEIYAFLKKGFGRNNATRVGELGFGTNNTVRWAVSENSHLNERVPGVHLGFGQHNQTEEIVGYSCDIHIDLCAKGGKIWFDDAPEPVDLEALQPSSEPHPLLISGEDVVSDDAEDDCCGMMR
jgi:leucyl aminopeptidase (aminopeptidase T)